MALECIISSSTNQYASLFIANCLNAIGATATVNTDTYKSVTFSNLFGDETERTFAIDNTKSISMFFWYDIDKKFAFFSYNSNLLNNKVFNSNSAYYNAWFPFLVFMKDGELVYAVGTSSSDETNIYNQKPFYINGAHQKAWFAYTNIPFTQLGAPIDDNNFTLIPCYIGRCRIPDMYVSIDNYAVTKQKITVGNDKYVALNSYMFYKIT